MRILIVVALALCTVTAARAEQKPWADGVSAERQKKALGLYKEGNGFFELDQYREALIRFEAALDVWDHPAIRYNAAVSSIHLDKIEEAYEHLTQALRFGAAPFTPDIYKEAQGYEKLLGGQLGEIEVSCAQDKVEITLDGKPLLVGPGTVTRRVRTGSHQVVAVKPGHITDTRSIEVKKREKAAVTIELKKPVAVAAPRKLQRRWARWKPWALVVAGGVVLGGGVGLYFHTANQYDEADTWVMGQPPGAATQAEFDRRTADANAWRAGTISAFAVGGVLVATGITLAFMNTPRLLPVNVTAQVGGDRTGLVLSGAW